MRELRYQKLFEPLPQQKSANPKRHTNHFGLSQQLMFDNKENSELNLVQSTHKRKSSFKKQREEAQSELIDIRNFEDVEDTPFKPEPEYSDNQTVVEHVLTFRKYTELTTLEEEDTEDDPFS